MDIPEQLNVTTSEEEIELLLELGLGREIPRHLALLRRLLERRSLLLSG